MNLRCRWPVLTICWRPEIRDFPKGLYDDQLDSLIDSCLRGIANTINLRSCAWTRDGSLSSSILLAILKHRQLQELEINGHRHRNCDHTILPQFTSVRRIKLVMPSPPVLEVLPAWLKSLKNPLQSLSIVCKVCTTLGIHRTQYLSQSRIRVPPPSRIHFWNKSLKICLVSTNFTWQAVRE